MDTLAINLAFETAEVDYWHVVDKLAAKVREEYLIPYCNLHNLYFKSNYFYWCFYDRNEEFIFHTDTLPYEDPELEKLLCLETLNSHIDLGSRIESFV